VSGVQIRRLSQSSQSRICPDCRVGMFLAAPTSIRDRAICVAWWRAFGRLHRAPRRAGDHAVQANGRQSGEDAEDRHADSLRAVVRSICSRSLRARSAVIDGEIVCVEPDGRSNFYQLFFRRDWPYRLMQDASTVVEE
jgi:hypothetical protein